MRVAENLNAALHELMAAERNLYLLGEDVADPTAAPSRSPEGCPPASPAE
ncbi:hypothetical protein [Nonomuraea dietziae]